MLFFCSLSVHHDWLYLWCRYSSFCPGLFLLGKHENRLIFVFFSTKNDRTAWNYLLSASLFRMQNSYHLHTLKSSSTSYKPLSHISLFSLIINYFHHYPPLCWWRQWCLYTTRSCLWLEFAFQGTKGCAQCSISPIFRTWWSIPTLSIVQIVHTLFHNPFVWTLSKWEKFQACLLHPWSTRHAH